MGSILAVAKQTFAKCLRTKVGGVMIILIILSLLATPLLSTSPAVPLSDRIRTFLTYSIGVVTVELSLATILLGAGAIASDVSDKHVFMLAVKPLARWQYVVGRWLGVVMLDAALLAAAGAAIYLIAQYMRSQEAVTLEDRRTVETEIFVARKRIGPDLTAANSKIDEIVRSRLEDLRARGRYEAEVEVYGAQRGLDKESAENQYVQQMRSDLTAQMQSVEPDGSAWYTFKGVDAGGEGLTDQGTVLSIFRDQHKITIRTPRQTMDSLFVDQPLRVNSTQGRVAATDRNGNYITVEFPEADMQSVGISSLKPDSPVTVEMDPVIQITYTPRPATLPDVRAPLYCRWLVQTPLPRQAPAGAWHPYQEETWQTDPPDVPSTLTVSARVVDADHTFEARYVNRSTPNFRSSVTIRWNEIAVLCREGTFEANLARGLAMILVELMFVAGLAVMAGTFLGFPVAVLLTMGMMLFTVARDSVTEGVGMMSPGLPALVFGTVNFIMGILLPDLVSLVPTEKLTKGLYIAWDLSSLAPAWFSLGGTALLLAVSCLIFHKRELARVQI